MTTAVSQMITSSECRSHTGLIRNSWPSFGISPREPGALCRSLLLVSPGAVGGWRLLWYQCSCTWLRGCENGEVEPFYLTRLRGVTVGGGGSGGAGGMGGVAYYITRYTCTHTSWGPLPFFASKTIYKWRMDIAGVRRSVSISRLMASSVRPGVSYPLSTHSISRHRGQLY